MFWMTLFGIVAAIFAFIGFVLFGSYSGAFASLGPSFSTCLQMVLQNYDPSLEIELSPQAQLSTAYYWTFQIITNFVLLNALLAIIVEAYDGSKRAAEQESFSDPFWIYYQQTMTAIAHETFSLLDFSGETKLKQHVPIDRMDLITVLRDLDRIYKLSELHPGLEREARHPETQKWMLVRIREALPDGRFKVKKVNYEEEKYEAGEDDVEIEFTVLGNEIRCPNNLNLQVIMEETVVEKVSLMDEEELETKSRFYLVNKGTVDEPKPALLDQLALVVAMKTIAPTMNTKVPGFRNTLSPRPGYLTSASIWQVCLAVTFRILWLFGVDADLNRGE